MTISNSNLSTEWTINILPASEIDKIVSNPLAIFNNETLPDGSTLNDCADLEAFLTSQNSTYTEGKFHDNFLTPVTNRKIQFSLS